MKLFSFLRSDPLKIPALRLYSAIVEQARRPEFYLRAGVPDSLDGRFELISMHVFLVMSRLREGGEEGAAFAQALFDTMFAEIDQALREVGVGDLGVGNRVKFMASGLLGRVEAYRAGLAAPPPALEEAIRRNLFGTVSAADADVIAMSDYLRREAAAMAGVTPADLMAAKLAFGPAPPGSAGP
jgi:cytochrome b pre-mRNA-processing protein 3